MSLFRWFGVAAVMVLAVACSSDTAVGPTGRFDHAAATTTCGPADGPAVAIYLTSEPVKSIEPSGVYVRIFIPGSVDQLAGTSWPIAANSEAGARYTRTANNYEWAKSGLLIVKSVASDNSVSGSVYLDFPDAGHIQGEFHADWFPAVHPCF
ncbi:MAG TPA: hypothetical protein VGD02_00310 [Gemmatimonadaceae bacterium]